MGNIRDREARDSGLIFIQTLNPIQLLLLWWQKSNWVCILSLYGWDPGFQIFYPKNCIINHEIPSRLPSYTILSLNTLEMAVCTLYFFSSYPIAQRLFAMRRYGGGMLYAALPLHMQRGCFRIRTHDQQVTKAQLYRCTRARPPVCTLY